MKEQIKKHYESSTISNDILDKQIKTLSESDFKGAQDWPDAEYHNGIGVSNSQLSDFAASPRRFHYKHILGNKDQSTEAMAIGDMIHKAILEPHLLNETYLSDAQLIDRVLEKKPETKKPTATKHYKDMVLESKEAGRVVIKDEYFSMMREMVSLVYNHPKAKHLLSNGVPEQCLYAKDPETGLILRGKADFIQIDGLIIDVKTTADASFDAFSKSIWNYRYHVQAAFYLYIAKLCIGEQFNNFVWICLEKQKPFDIAIYTPDEGALDYGERMFKKNLKELAECYEKDVWPGYPEDPQLISLPYWADSKADNLI